jgi:hypothetical protein
MVGSRTCNAGKMTLISDASITPKVGLTERLTVSRKWQIRFLGSQERDFFREEEEGKLSCQ